MGIFDIFRKSPAPQKAAPRVSTRRYRAPADKTSPGGWYPFGGSVERAPAALPLIRSRARDLAHNNSYASRAVSVLTSHTVGSGIRFSIRGDEDYEAQFAAWAASTDCDYEGRLNLYGIQAVATRTMFESGDAFIIMRQARISTGLRPTLQLVDPDQLDEGASPRGKDNRVIAGVEIDRSGRIVGYHVRAELDGTIAKTDFIRASDVIHLFEQLHPGQVRGIPRGAQALVRANSVDSFMTAALARARVEACFSAFVTGPSLSDDSGIIGEIQEDDGYVIPELLEPGTVIPLPDGHDVKFAVPSGSGGLRDYIEINLQSIAVAYGVTYAQLSGDVSKANYSSEKASRLEFYRGVDTVRAHFVMPALSRIERAFRVAYEASEGRDVEARVTMTAPGRESIEPSKDAAADMISLASGGMTFGQYCLARGLDPEDQLQSLKAEREHMSDLGVSLKFGAVDIGALLAAATAPNPDETDEEDDPASA
jgi:lambda family phage portal protein